jgi:hypothetical protein
MLKRHPFGHGGTAWAFGRRSALVERAAGCDVRGSAGLQAADDDEFLPGPDLQREGAAAAADDGVGAVVQRQGRAMLELELCLGKEKAETEVSKVF